VLLEVVALGEAEPTATLAAEEDKDSDRASALSRPHATSAAAVTPMVSLSFIAA
jgi:hypothetical protein